MPLKIETELEFDLEDLQYDIEDSRETDRWNDAPQEIKELFHVLEWNIIDGEHPATTGFINQALDMDVTARTLIAGPMATGIAEVGQRPYDLSLGAPLLFDWFHQSPPPE